MPEAGFEPAHPKITELKSAALDHSAIQAIVYCLFGPFIIVIEINIITLIGIY